MAQETYQDLEEKQRSWNDLIREFNALGKPYTLDSFIGWVKDNYSSPKPLTNNEKATILLSNYRNR